MQIEPDSDHHIWAHAALAAALMVLVPTRTVTILWFTDPSLRDSDMTGVQELIFFFLLILTAPASALEVLAPATIALDRLARGQTSRLAMRCSASR